MTEQLLIPVEGINRRHESPRYHQFKDLESDFAYELGYIDFDFQETVCNSFGLSVPGKGASEPKLTRDRLELLILRCETAIQFLKECRESSTDTFLSDLDYVDVEGTIE